MTSATSIYDAEYFAHGCGRPYARDDYWLGFFDGIAERIAADIAPRSVLDAGCAMGFLVERLRARGIEAYGVDISEYAISKVDPSVSDYCWVASVTDPFPRRYDLIVCIEVLEHLERRDSERAVANLCAHTDDILFSSSPDDFAEPTHLNVQPPEYWGALFAAHSFYRDTEIEPFITAWSTRFRRRSEPFSRIVAGYERRLWRLERESRAARETVAQQRADVAEAHEWVGAVFFRSAPHTDVAVAPQSEQVAIGLRSAEHAFNIATEGHSLWCFADGRGALAFEAALDVGVYRFTARTAAMAPGELQVSLGGGPPHKICDLAPDVRDIAPVVDVREPVSFFELKVEGSGRFAAIGDLHLWRIPRGDDLRNRRRSRAKRRSRGRIVHALRRRVARAGLQVTRSLQRAPYEIWRERRIELRAGQYRPEPERGLLSLLTSAWNTPAVYIRELGASVLSQDFPHFEWIVLDNGSTDATTVSALADLASDNRVRVFRVEQNLGIVGGMRFCLERAAGRYVLPLDSDDVLTRDCLSIVAAALQEHDYPPLLYTDEDKLYDGRYVDGYLKPDWDPVLFVNSCYIAHFCAIDRVRALELGAYTDAEAEASHDWDTFMRFALDGDTPVHVPEVVYSWRMHPDSAALDIHSKPRVASSQTHVLRKFLAAHPSSSRYSVEQSPLFAGTPDWWFRREHRESSPILTLVLELPGAVAREIGTTYRPHSWEACHVSDIDSLREIVRRDIADEAVIQFVHGGLRLAGNEWPWELLTLLELHPDTVMIGGRAYDQDGTIVAAGEYLGFGGVCGCPDVGRAIQDPGYFAQMWKQRSVGAVSTILAAARVSFLRRLLRDLAAVDVSIPFLGAWAGAYAATTGERIVYTPHMSAGGAVDRSEWDALVTDEERLAFATAHADQLADSRFLSPLLSRDRRLPYVPIVEPAAAFAERRRHSARREADAFAT